VGSGDAKDWLERVAGRAADAGERNRDRGRTQSLARLLHARIRSYFTFVCLASAVGLIAALVGGGSSTTRAATAVATLGSAIVLIAAQRPGLQSRTLHGATILVLLTIFFVLALFPSQHAAAAYATLGIAGILLSTAGALPWGIPTQVLLAGAGTAAWLFVGMRTGATTPDAFLFLSLAWTSPLLAGALSSQWRDQWRRSEEARALARAETMRARALAAAGSDLLENLGSTELAERACQVTRESLGAAFVVALTKDGEGNLRASAQKGLEESDWEAYAMVSVPADLGSSIDREVRETGVFLLEPEAPPDQPVFREFADFFLRIDLGSILFLELRPGGRPVGILVACRWAPAPKFGDSEVRTAEGLAPLIAASFENAQLFEALDSANRVQHELLAGISHELRTPLNVIIGYLDILLDDGAGPLLEEQKRLCLRVRASAGRQLMLVREALELSRRDASGGVTVRRDDIDIDALFEELRGEAALRADSEAPVIHWRVGHNLTNLESDPIKLRMILHNLIENARQHADAENIFVEADQRGEEVVLTVTDDGRGMNETVQAGLFEAFHRGAGAQSGGLGLGLHIVHRLADALRARIEVESREGSGASFAVFLPLRPTHREAPLRSLAVGAAG
jgi:signal transduction histidine kinase